MNCGRWLAGSGLVLGAVAFTLLVNSCSTTSRVVLAPPPAIEGAAFVGDKVCADCHATITRVFPASPHARLHLEIAGMSGQQGCEACHGPGSKHVAAGGGSKFIVNPKHDPAACFQCHLDTHAEFSLPQHHPVVEGRMDCVQCHDPHGMDIMKPATALGLSRQNDTCAGCHRQETKPFVFEHAALREGCAICHNPHGSVNAKLLVQRDNNLCLRCHVQVVEPSTVGPGIIVIGKEDHTSHLRYGACWTAGCHTAVHGSNINPYLFY